MADSPRAQVRPTIRFLCDLGLSFPRLNEPLWRISHPLVAHMQQTPDEVRASGAEPIRSLSDRLWWKCDFYRQLQAEALRHGRGTGKPSTSHLLPQQVDADRLTAETAALAVEATRTMILGLVARSLIDGKAYAAFLSGHIITALVRAKDGGEAYLAIAAEGFIQPRMIALILSAVPGIGESDWQAEPGGVSDIEPKEGQIIWSTMIPPDIQARILELAETADEDL